MHDGVYSPILRRHCSCRHHPLLLVPETGTTTIGTVTIVKNALGEEIIQSTYRHDVAPHQKLLEVTEEALLRQALLVALFPNTGTATRRHCRQHT